MTKTRRLTELKIRNLPIPKTGQKRYYDDLPGFHIRVSQGGTKTFAVLYGPNRRQKVIGRWPIISLAEAREKARAILNSHVLDKRPSPHFQDALEEHLLDKANCLRPSTFNEHTRLLRRLNLDTTLDELTTSDCLKALNAIEAPSERAHTYTALKTFLNWAVAREYSSKNALQSVPKPKTGTERTRVLDDAEIAKLWAATHGNVPYHLLVRLLLLTGQRRNQIASLDPKWINYKNHLLTFPPAIMKSGREHTTPTTPLIEFHLRQADDPCRPFHIWTWSRHKNRLDELLPIDPWCLHDLRRTFSTIHARIGTPPHIIERLLDHQQGTLSPIARIYNRHSYLPAMRSAMEAYSAFIFSIIESDGP